MSPFNLNEYGVESYYKDWLSLAVIGIKYLSIEIN